MTRNCDPVSWWMKPQMSFSYFCPLWLPLGGLCSESQHLTALSCVPVAEDVPFGWSHSPHTQLPATCRDSPAATGLARREISEWQERLATRGGAVRAIRHSWASGFHAHLTLPPGMTEGAWRRATAPPFPLTISSPSLYPPQGTLAPLLGREGTWTGG